MKRWLLLAAALTAGCGTPRQPPLPKFALGEAPPSGEVTWAAKLRQIDVIYFCLTKKGDAEDQPVGRIVKALRESGEKVALGWTEIAVGQQPLLDRWQRKEIAGSELRDQLGLATRDDWLSHDLGAGVRYVALGAPAPLLRKIRAGEALTPEERMLLPRDFHSRPEALDDFADRVANSARLRRYNFPRLFRAHLVAEQMIAENVVGFIREQPKTKLLVFLPNDIMIEAREVADYAAQKMKLRQMILDRATGAPPTRPQLLARR